VDTETVGIIMPGISSSAAPARLVQPARAEQQPVASGTNEFIDRHLKLKVGVSAGLGIAFAGAGLITALVAKGNVRSTAKLVGGLGAALGGAGALVFGMTRTPHGEVIERGVKSEDVLARAKEAGGLVSVSNVGSDYTLYRASSGQPESVIFVKDGAPFAQRKDGWPLGNDRLVSNGIYADQFEQRLAEDATVSPGSNGGSPNGRTFFSD
jgi:hypothetical protein